MEQENLYYWQAEDGTQSELMDIASLQRLAREGVITPYCKVRSQYIPKWEKAVNIPFLKETLQKIVQKEKLAEQNTLWRRLKRRIFLEAEDEAEKESTLGLSSTASYPPASFLIRLLVWLADMFLLAVWALVLYLICAFLYSRGILKAENVVYVGFGIWWFTFILYFTLGMSFFTQTVGQRIWGIQFVRCDDHTHSVGRSFFYFLASLIVGITTPFLMCACGRTLQEMLLRVRIVKNIK